MSLRSSVPYLEHQIIEVKAAKLLRWIRPSILTTPSLTPIAEIAEGLSREFGVKVYVDQDLGYSKAGKKILGICQFWPKVIYLDRSLDPNKPRYRFTLAHEIGHLVLHRRLGLRPSDLDAPLNQIRDDRTHVFGRRQVRSARDRLEWQANAFAAALLMPSRTIAIAVRARQAALGIRRSGSVYVDDQPVNLADYSAIVAQLTEIYQVSRTSLDIRLQQLGILDDRRAAGLRHVLQLERVA